MAMYLTWTWFAGFFLADGCITTKSNQVQIRVFQTNERLIDEIKDWLESQGIHPYKTVRKHDNHAILCIYRHHDILEVTPFLIENLPEWHYKTVRLKEGMAFIQKRLEINRPHIENGERDELGRFRRGHTYREYCLEGKEDEFRKLYLDKTLTIGKVAEKLGVSPQTVRRTRKRLNLPLKSDLP